MWKLDGEMHLEINANSKSFICEECNKIITTNFYDTVQNDETPYIKTFFWKCHICNNFYRTNEEDSFKKMMWLNANFIESINELAKNSGGISDEETKDTDEWIKNQRKKVLENDN